MRSPANTGVFTTDDLRGETDIAARFGVKAAELCAFGWRCEQLGHPVPRTWLLPAEALDPALSVSAAASPRYPRLPVAEAVPAGSGDPARRFRREARDVLSRLSRVPRGLLRSSRLWPDPRTRPPGVDITVDADDPRRAERLWRGLHKAYTELCHRHIGPATPTRAGLMVTEAITVGWEGTAYRIDGRIALECGTGDVESVLCDTPQELAATGLADPDRARWLFAALRELFGDMGFAEIEFLVDAGGRFVPTQCRTLERGPLTPVPFHSEITVEGPLIDLRGRPRTVAVVERGLRPGAVVVVPVRDDARADLFALLWLAVTRRRSGPAAVVSARGRGTHAGMPTHLRWLATAVLPQTAHFYLSDRAVPRGLATMRLSPEGVHDAITEEAR